MTYRVQITDEAGKDLLDIWEYVALNDDPAKADTLLDRLEETCATLTHHPLKGHLPPELERVGVDSYREIHYKPYRVIYEISHRDVFVHTVVDGRRDLQSVLERRLLR